MKELLKLLENEIHKTNSNECDKFISKLTGIIREEISKYQKINEGIIKDIDIKKEELEKLRIEIGELDSKEIEDDNLLVKLNKYIEERDSLISMKNELKSKIDNLRIECEKFRKLLELDEDESLEENNLIGVQRYYEYKIKEYVKLVEKREELRDDYIKEIDEISSQLKIKTETDKSIFELKETLDHLNQKLNKNKQTHKELIKDIKERESVLISFNLIESIIFDEIFTDKYILMLKEYKEKLIEIENDNIERIFNKYHNELVSLREIFQLNTDESSDKNLQKVIEEIKNLKCRKDDFLEIKTFIDERVDLLKSMEEFEKLASDPKRLFKSSFQLNKEEKFRKTAYPNLIKLEESIFNKIENYERKHGKFIFNRIEYKDFLKREIENRGLLITFDTPQRKKLKNLK
ncbi:hypothetical protein A0H76_983 [Hepatospora eriocheir]|uniref:Uncharacterized protein n=1 Tax=Hepatospora eriocheir TaxID=1081669 RepID=A0A1X0QHZ7_9MICR|nr:hypothetical protein A0H76_983 [Hepatospora eriocheir]